MGRQHLAVEPPPGEPETGILADNRMEGTGRGAQNCERCGISCQAEKGIKWIRCRVRRSWQRLNLGLDLRRAPHPGFRTDRPRPIGEARDVPEILTDMLLAHPTGRDHPARGKSQRLAEHGFQQEDTFGMVAQSSVPEVSKDEFRGIEPGMQVDVILDHPAPFLNRGQGVMIWMCHVLRPQKLWLNCSDEVNRSL